VFCLVIAEVLRRVLASPALAGVDSLHWLCVDGWIVQTPLPAALALLGEVDDSADTSNLPLQQRKCSFQVPALRDVPECDWPAAARELKERIPHQPDGLVLVGTEACGGRAMPLCTSAYVSLLRPCNARRAPSYSAASSSIYLRLRQQLAPVIRPLPLPVAS
jgi:hypothetical protein